MASGTHPFSRWQDQAGVARTSATATFLDRLGWPVRRLAISGTHVHVGVSSGEAAVAITGRCASSCPLLLALSASSPYWDGEDTDPGQRAHQDLRGPAHLGAPAAARRVGRLRGLHARPAPRRRHPVDPRGLVGHPPPPRLRHRGAADVRRGPHPAGDPGDRGPRPVPRGAPGAPPGRRPAGGRAERTGWWRRTSGWRVATGWTADLLVGDQGDRRPARELLAELVDELSGVAVELGCAEELATVLDIAESGSSHDRQRQVIAEGGTPRDVVQHLVSEFRGAGGFR